MFDPNRLKQLRLNAGRTAASVAQAMAVSPAQLHRLENGQRRLTVDTYLSYCNALGIDPGRLLSQQSPVPITGIINSDFEVQAVPPNTPTSTLAPPLLEDMSRVAALRWSAGRRFQPMEDHIVFYEKHDCGVLEIAWDKRCLIVCDDGRRYLGWPKRSNDSAHIDFGSGPAEFNVDIIWASPALAVMPPFALATLTPT